MLPRPATEEERIKAFFLKLEEDGGLEPAFKFPCTTPCHACRGRSAAEQKRGKWPPPTT